MGVYFHLKHTRHSKTMKTILKQELTGWKRWEVSWIFLACAVIIGLSIYWQDSILGIISATSGVICVICTGKGKLSAYLFGLVNSILYAIIAYQAAYYGETMLNALYYAPMQIVGFCVWKKHMNAETAEVNKRHMTKKKRIFYILCIAVSTLLYGLVLKLLGGAMPYVDSFTTTCSVIAMIVSIGMYAEQWWIWICVDIFTIYLWSCDFMAGNDNIATLLMWIVYLGNAIIMCIKWEAEVMHNEKKLEQKAGNGSAI